jgi:hypothetical protein
MPEGFEQTNAAAELFGSRGGKQILAILKETNGDLDGAINRFREMGILISTDAARAADKFNDELALLDFQLRAAGTVAAEELIPAFVDIIRVTGDLVRDLGPLLKAFSNLAGPVVRSVGEGMKGLGIVVSFLTRDYKALAEAIKEANEQATIFKDINPQAIPSINVPGPSPIALPKTTALEDAKTFAQAAEATSAAAKRQAQVDKQIQDELFQQGRISRQQQAEAIIRINKFVLENEQRAIGARLAQKEDEIKQLNQSDVQYRDNLRQAAVEVQKLQQEALDKEADFDVKARALRANAAKERSDDARKSRAEETEDLIAEFDRQIANTQAAIQRGAQIESEGISTIEAAERAKIEARREGLEEQKRIGGLTIEEQKAFDRQLAKLQQDAKRLADEQNNARLQREREVSERIRDIKLGEIDTAIALQRIAGERTIAAIEAQARLRVKTEGDAAREILRIKLDLINQEIEATEARVKAAGSIVNVNERLKAEAELNSQLKILRAQRVTIEDEGNRNIEDKRQEDLENERRYANDLQDVKDRIIRIEQSATEEILRLMIIHSARRRDVIRARARLDIEDENSRHRQADETIRNLEQENRESTRTQAEKNAEAEELNHLREAEEKRHQLAIQAIRDQAKKDEQESTPLGRLGFDAEGLGDFAGIIKDAFLSPIEAIKEAFAELQEAMRAFVAETETTIVPLGEILRNTFSQFADAIGQTVSNWVLLGETGPAVMRKILAQALASIAAEAAVNAIKELALGFATLFFNPAESAAHFTSAALWGSIAGAAAIAGRAVAGDLFKPKSGSQGSGSSERQGSNQLDPATLNRNQPQPIRIVVVVQPDGTRFAQAVTAHILEDGRNGGPIRQFNLDDQVI